MNEVKFMQTDLDLFYGSVVGLLLGIAICTGFLKDAEQTLYEQQDYIDKYCK